MSAFSTISALRRRRPEDLPEGNAAAGGGSLGAACWGRLAGSGSQGGLAGGGLAGGALQGAPCWGGRLAGGASQGALADRHPVRGMFPLLALRSDPLRPDQSGHRATFRPLLPSGHLSASVCCSAAGASPPSGPPALRRCPAASARPQPRNLTTPQPRNPATPQPRNLTTPQPRNPATPQPRNHAATQPPQPLSHAKRALPAWGEPFCIGMASCAYPRNESRIPAATAEPTTPATLGPMACISR